MFFLCFALFTGLGVEPRVLNMLDKSSASYILSPDPLLSKELGLTSWGLNFTKKKLKVADLLNKFEEASGGEFANDRMMLAN